MAQDKTAIYPKDRIAACCERKRKERAKLSAEARNGLFLEPNTPRSDEMDKVVSSQASCVHRGKENDEQRTI